MIPPRLSQLAARLIAREAETSHAPPEGERRKRSIAVVELALRRRARRRVLARALTALAAAAAILIVVNAYRGASRPHTPEITASSPSGMPAPPRADIEAHPRAAGASVAAASGGAGAVLAPLGDGRSLQAGSRVSTPARGGAELDVSTGTQLVLGERTELNVVDEGALEQFTLSSGTLEAHVAKLGATERFVVRTPDAEVEVRGTRFRVSIVGADASCGSGTVTRVVVLEGLVAVRNAGVETLVGAGASWPGACEAPPPPGATAPTSAPAPSIGQSSTLAAENALFARAMTAKQRGATDEAIADLDRLVAWHPGGPLAESAAVERMRLLGSTDPRRAVDAARAYLRRYPSGFARAEAEGLAGRSP